MDSIARTRKLVRAIFQCERKVFVCLFVWLVSERPRQLLGYIADGPQDRASDNFTCCHT